MVIHQIYLHADDESMMDKAQPIVVLTLGASRKVDFFQFYQASSETPVLTISPNDGQAYHMLPGCQTYFKHRLLKDFKCKSPRFALSFRRILPTKQYKPGSTASPHPPSRPVENRILPSANPASASNHSSHIFLSNISQSP